ncbi:hypothetical protein SK128_019269 [Halocaridina rubra]|uniref:Uncharacterized protein n=1 Tax=Halocaridina rubra TaxID=373956 RepID=A0AAN9A7X1_HALRR
MSHRTNRPHSWCPRGESPLRIPEGGSASSPVASPGLHGLPPAVASPRSTPTPFKLRRLSYAGDRSGSPMATPAGGVALPHLQLLAQQQQELQAVHQAVTLAAQQQQQQQQQQNSTTLLEQQSEEQTLQEIEEESTQQTSVQQQQQSVQLSSLQQSGVFYPMPQHPASPAPVQQLKYMELQRPLRQSPILLREPTGVRSLYSKITAAALLESLPKI